MYANYYLIMAILICFDSVFDFLNYSTWSKFTNVLTDLSWECLLEFT